AEGFGQKVTLSAKNAKLEDVFHQIRQQTGYTFTYTASLLDRARPVSIDIDRMDLEQALNECLKEQPFSYVIIEKTILVKLKGEEKKGQATVSPPVEVTGRIVDEKGNPVVATVAVKGTSNAVSTDVNGYFTLKGVDKDATLVISGVNIETYEAKVNGRT